MLYKTKSNEQEIKFQSANHVERSVIWMKNLCCINIGPVSSDLVTLYKDKQHNRKRGGTTDFPLHTQALLTPGINATPEWSDHKWTYHSTRGITGSLHMYHEGPIWWGATFKQTHVNRQNTGNVDKMFFYSRKELNMWHLDHISKSKRFF